MVKPGSVSAHQRNEAAVKAALRRAGFKGHYMAMSSLTGPSEVWFVHNYRSIAGWQKTTAEMNSNDALRGTLNQLSERDSTSLLGSSDVVAVVRNDLSRSRNDLSRLHYFGVTTVQVQTGHEDDFTRLLKTALDDCKDCYWATYEVIAGMPSPSFMIVTSHKNLSELDAADGKSSTGWGEVGERAIGMAQKNGYAHSETELFKVEPSMSYEVPEGVMSTIDPEWWPAKPAAPLAKKK